MQVLSLPLSRWISCLALAFGMAGCTAGGGGGVQEGTTSYESGGQRIKVETYLPAGDGRHPAVLVLYGSGGALLGKSEMTDFAKRLAANGVSAYVIHYFNRTGTVAAGDDAINKHWHAWLAAVKDGVDFVSRHPRARPDSLGMFGYSLGAYLSIAEGIQDSRIRAVAEIAGGVFDELQGRGTRFPPTLVLHGRNDERVPAVRIQAVQREARRFGAEPQMKLYDNEGHRLSAGALQDASDRSLAFLKEHLKP